MWFPRSIWYEAVPFTNASKAERSVGNGEVFGILLMNLSKVLNCVDSKLLIAKLNAYGFSLLALKVIHDNLLNRK